MIIVHVLYTSNQDNFKNIICIISREKINFITKKYIINKAITSL